MLGTPAEESGGGKIRMINNGCFDDLDFCLLVHPKPLSCIYVNTLASEHVHVTYTGCAAHAAAFPWEGINALDAAVCAYSNVSALRQQMKPTWRVHGVFTEAGVKPNIIPERASLQFQVRASNAVELKVLHNKMQACFDAAAVATGEHFALNSAIEKYRGIFIRIHKFIKMLILTFTDKIIILKYKLSAMKTATFVR